MRITKIERQKKHPSRKSVFIDDAFAFGVTDEVMVRFSLHQGAELDKETVEKILLTENEETAKQKAFRFLAIRPRSKKEIRDYLSRKEYAEPTIANVVAKLESMMMLDDLSFARMVCRDALAKKPVGEKMLRQGLFRKGVPKSIMETVVGEFFTPESELLLALKAAELQRARVRRSSKKIDEVQLKKKILDFLVRRGFDFETAMSATKQILAE